MNPTDTPTPASAPLPPPAGRGRLVRSAVAMAVLTLLSRVLGLVREQVRSYFLGTGAASDAFGLAATLPNLLRRLFAEGATTAAFIPVFTETMKTESREELWRFTSRFLTLLTLAVTFVTVIGISLTPWLIETFFAEKFSLVPGKVALTIVLTQVMFPYLILVSVAAILQGVLNSFKVFAPSAFAPVLMNLAIIAAAAGLSHLFADPSYAFAVGFLLGGVAQMAFQIPYVVRLGATVRPRFDFWTPRVRRVLRIMAPGVFAAGIYQINVFASQLIASRLDQGSIAALQYSVRLQELVLGVFVVSLTTVILPTLSEQVVDADHAAARDTVAHATGLMGLVTLPATVALVLLGLPIVRLLFQHGEFGAHSSFMTAYALFFHALALWPIAVGRIFQQVFFATKDQATPMRVAAVGMVVNVGLCVLLPPLMGDGRGHGGIAAAGAVAAVWNAVALVVLTRQRVGALPWARMAISLARTALATAVMGAVILGLLHALDMGPWWPDPTLPAPTTGRLVLAGKLALTGAAAGAAFLAAARVVRCPEYVDLLQMVRRRLKRGRGRSAS